MERRTRITGKGNISATIIADSISAHSGKRIITYELEYHRFVHAELMTHRLFSRNAASSRAITIERMIDHVQKFPAIPIYWGAKQAGMQAFSECNNDLEINEYLAKEWINTVSREQGWEIAMQQAIIVAESFDKAGYHKQAINRILEPFQIIKVVVTTTETDNFFNLRREKHAQPEIKELADCMYTATQESVPVKLRENDWHTPYYKDGYFKVKLPENMLGNHAVYGLQARFESSWENVFDESGSSLKDALMVSSSCCAQVSYRRLDDSLEKADDIFHKLVDTRPLHASALEHCASPLLKPVIKSIQLNSNGEFYFGHGATHMDTKGNVWSGNFQHWTQFRQLLPNHTCWEYEEGVTK